MQSYNAADRDEKTHEEDQHNADFAFRAPGLQRYEIGDREEEYHLQDPGQYSLSDISKSCSLLTRTKSKKMFKALFAYVAALTLRHPPLCSPSHCFQV